MWRLALSSLILAPALILAQEQDSETNIPDSLGSFDLEELAEVRVTMASRVPERAFGAAAAVHVVTPEDIRRTGATSVAEALRIVPGLNVARLNSQNWAISSRGFNDSFANKLQVLIDGRSVYTPLYSGVYWDVQDLVLEDIDRIEVVRGPGAALWGANAVNGVINIVTKPASETQGGLVSGGTGTVYRGSGTVRYGGQLGKNGYYRTYLKAYDREDFESATGQEIPDGGQMVRGGFRADWVPSSINSMTFQGDLYKGDNGSYDDGRVAGGNLLGRWTRYFSEDSEAQLQGYYDRTERTVPMFTEYRTTLDLDFQHRFPLGDHQSIIWGLGYRITRDNTFGSPTLQFTPQRSTDHLRSILVQDKIALIDTRLELTIGSKFEINDYTGLEVQPNVRLSWRPTERQSYWAAVGRAVRSPSRAETAINAETSVPASFAAPPGTTALLLGSPLVTSEELIAYDIGARWRVGEKLHLDVAAFYNDYDKIRSSTTGTPFVSFTPAPHPVIPLHANNRAEGETYGGELAATWEVLDWWRLMGSYSLLQMHLRNLAGLGDSTLEPDAGNSPQQQFHLRSYMNLTSKLDLDSALYFVDELPTQSVPSYVRWDLRLGWRPRHDLEVSVAAQNLLDNRHPEFGNNSLVQPSMVERSYHLKVSWQF